MLGKPSIAFPVQILEESIKNIFFLNSFTIYVILVVHSRRGNLKQGESENVDGNTRLALDPLV